MNDLFLVKHAYGAPGLRYFGLGPKLRPIKGIMKLRNLFEDNTSGAKNRSSKDIRNMLSKSSVVVSLWKDKALVGFGRATSDTIYRAVLWDIVVDKNFQNLGLGKIIVKAILENDLISKTERVYIMTTNCEKFYSNIGFKLETSKSLMKLKKYLKKRKNS